MWSIAIQTGETPLGFSDPPNVQNPVLRGCDVTDVRAAFVADPFMIPFDDGWYMFFEVMNEDRGMGEIGLATSADCLSWKYERIVLREPFHLSYPYLFAKNGRFFMVPETLGLGSVQVYRAKRFPELWEPCARIPIYGADPSLFEHAGLWWMFTASDPYHNATLRLHSAEWLRGPWQEHPASPIVANDKSIARPAGRVVVDGGRIIRYTQDCEREYGTKVRAFEITELDRRSYREVEVAASPVLEANANQPWRTRRAHHVDPHEISKGRWISCVDGDCFD
jgi:hypothetical protein